MKSVRQRILFPVLTVFIIMILSHIGYFSSRHIDNDTLHQAMSAVFGTMYFLSVAFGTMYVYTMAYVNGSAMNERILASFVNPFIWMSKEVIRIHESHPLVECLYWYVNPLTIWLVSLMVLEMGIATLLARKILAGRGHDVKVVTTAPLIVIFGSLTFVISAYAWGRGENIYVIFLEGYRCFFGSGI